MVESSSFVPPKLSVQPDVRVLGARENNLQDVDLTVPRDATVVFTGVSGSGKSSLAFGTLYAESQRRYLESVAPYARRLIDQAGVPDVDSITGMPPAVALQQQRGSGNARSTVGSITTLSSLVRMLYSRAGDYPEGQPMLYAEDFSANTVQGACSECHGIGRVYEVNEQQMVPDPSLTIRERAIASWPTAWHGHQLRDVLVALGYDVDVPWRDLPKKDRDWILYTDETPFVPVHSRLTLSESKAAIEAGVEPSYSGTFVGARRYILDTFANTKSASMKRRVAQFLTAAICPTCNGKRLKPEALSVTFEGFDIAEFSQLPLRELATILSGVVAREEDHEAASSDVRPTASRTPEKRAAAVQLASGVLQRLRPLVDLGLGYLSLSRTTPTLSGGELQRLRLATQLSSDLFGVVYVLDEPSAGLHPQDVAALLEILDGLKGRGNSLFIVEHSVAVMRHADWLVDIGPGAGEHGGRVLYSGPPDGLAGVTESVTRGYLFGGRGLPLRTPREARSWLRLENVTRNNLHDLTVDIPLGVFTAVTGVSGSGKSSLVSQALPSLLGDRLGLAARADDEPVSDESLLADAPEHLEGRVAGPVTGVQRLVVIDQRPIGRTPRSNVATYTGLFDHVRRRFADTPEARSRGYKPGRFSFNVAGGRCPTCEGEGSVMVELLFLPSVYTECPDCHGTRYKASTLEVTWRGRTIADVLSMSVEEANLFFVGDEEITRSLAALSDVGLEYLRLGQPATELSGGEAQRVKLATELQRAQRGDTLYVLDEPTSGLHCADTDRLVAHLQTLVDAGNTVVAAELDMRVVAVADHVIDLGPGAGDAGGTVVAAGTPAHVADQGVGASAGYLAAALQAATNVTPS
ncbi:excinuclease ABC subunit UvrA [Micrococcus luteus]|uniref:excinuclease ABC subunit UvrA n=1 Tax=Micrococcus TaxID=1269 RepID=UPI00044DCA99|nr:MULTISPECIES: excinuclease ABC subunit UvrA [Micrococcus]TKW70971.1 MAG: excinuclease ABC subunit UvrA [Cutibacterium acnes]AYO49207.1 excinuclease ABC subunit UvrA [Micrococcus luteus]EZP62117.1 Excinuclease ABC, A subunit [Micrococcus luteus]MCD0181752.1 excinuclease ABC subunit UvrA [Micrococcus luteus]MCK1800609.1 excinuclease ABC subunit UvrA [Micrococcus sp. XM4230B]